jgi:hypothetical protein
VSDQATEAKADEADGPGLYIGVTETTVPGGHYRTQHVGAFESRAHAAGQFVGSEVEKHKVDTVRDVTVFRVPQDIILQAAEMLLAAEGVVVEPEDSPAPPSEAGNPPA